MLKCCSLEKTFLFLKGEIILDSWPSATSCTLRPSCSSFVLSPVHSCHPSTHPPIHLPTRVSTHSPPARPPTRAPTHSPPVLLSNHASTPHSLTHPSSIHSSTHPPIHPWRIHLFLRIPAATMPRVLAVASLSLVPSALRAESPGTWGWEGSLLLWSLEVPPPREAEAVPPARGSRLGASSRTLALLAGPLALGAS